MELFVHPNPNAQSIVYCSMGVTGDNSLPSYMRWAVSCWLPMDLLCFQLGFPCEIATALTLFLSLSHGKKKFTRRGENLLPISAGELPMEKPVFFFFFAGSRPELWWEKKGPANLTLSFPGAWNEENGWFFFCLYFPKKEHETQQHHRQAKLLSKCTGK